MTTKTINVNELQAQISPVLRDVHRRGTVYEVIRYSEPFAVVLSYDEYRHLRGECKRCVDDLREVMFKLKE